MTSHTHADPIEQALERARHYLPAQGPIGVFVHHNTLHAFEGESFEEAVLAAAELYGAEPFMSLDFYQGEAKRGRIGSGSLEAEVALREPADTRLLEGRIPSRKLALYLLEQLGPDLDEASIDHWLWEGGGLEKLSPPARGEHIQAYLFEVSAWLGARIEEGTVESEWFVDVLAEPSSPLGNLCADRSPRALRTALRREPRRTVLALLWSLVAHGIASSTPAPPEPRRPRAKRKRDLLLESSGVDVDALVNDVLVPRLAAFLDQGLAYWSMPNQGSGLYDAVGRVFEHTPAPRSAVVEQVRRRISEDREAGRTPRSSLEHSLLALGHPREEWAEILELTALALPGWTGLIAKLEAEPELAPGRCPPVRLEEFLAIRLLVERAALEVTGRAELGCGFRTEQLWCEPRSTGDRRRARQRSQCHRVFSVLRDFGISPAVLQALSAGELSELTHFVERYDETTRRRIYHRAYEREHRLQILSALARHRSAQNPSRTKTPSLQLVFCIDDREESLRRHLEELDPSVETFGTAGFFGVAVAYRGLDDGYHASLCPIVQKPLHRVHEQARPGHDHSAHRYRSRRRLLSIVRRGGYTGTRGLLRGFLSTFGLGVLSLLPLSLRVLHPRTMSRASRFFARALLPEPETELMLERREEERGSLALFPGFTKEEMAERVERVLRDVGLVRHFSRLVALIGHGSSSLNNPLGSAYDCGACGGRKGGPNARLFARMANDPEVRRRLREGGLLIPEDTVFLGGYHDTANEGVTWFDSSEVPRSHERDLAALERLVREARPLDAHERCRRFESIPLGVTARAALAHVEGRAEDLAQPRPELGHATNAIAVFGRRGLTRGLFLDRRAFLVSYDPTIDEDGEVLGRLLAAMGPVGAGINLEYYFSRVDPERYGSGTKLPHNVVGLVGIMNGSLGDLRTGLPQQMVEIHEPVRLLCVVEATPERLARVAARYPDVARLIENQWIQLALVHPETGEVTDYQNGHFIEIVPRGALPEVERSHDWYRGKREHLAPALVRASLLSREGAA